MFYRRLCVAALEDALICVERILPRSALGRRLSLGMDCQSKKEIMKAVIRLGRSAAKDLIDLGP